MIIYSTINIAAFWSKNMSIITKGFILSHLPSRDEALCLSRFGHIHFLQRKQRSRIIWHVLIPMDNQVDQLFQINQFHGIMFGDCLCMGIDTPHA
ncbi:hypothetical protein A5N86_11925 [Geobacillus thermoleovorans]|nr:hypothetical protein A5N86_11925 [Geobacillus thermoleovorans]